MSHFAEVKTKIKDPALLRKALANLMGTAEEELDFSANGTVRGYQGNTKTADFVLGTSGSFDVGFIQQDDGSFTIVTDQWGLNKDRKSPLHGSAVGAINCAYQSENVKNEAAKLGLNIYETTTLEDGSMQIELHDYSGDGEGEF